MLWLKFRAVKVVVNLHSCITLNLVYLLAITIPIVVWAFEINAFNDYNLSYIKIRTNPYLASDSFQSECGGINLPTVQTTLNQTSLSWYLFGLGKTIKWRAWETEGEPSKPDSQKLSSAKKNACDLRFSRWWRFRLWSSGLWRRVDLYTVSQVRITSIFSDRSWRFVLQKRW
jgi:hypothetical protein